MVFQGYKLYPHMSVRDNMAFSLKLRGVPAHEIDQRVRRAADMLGIEEYLSRQPRALSGGQQQRVALGRALVRDPHVFLLDEPLSNLDAKLRAQTRIEITRLHQTTRTTFVYVTHDQVEAMTMGDRIAALNAGAIQQLGTPQELYDRPANLFVAGFIGSPAMDFFSATLRRAGEDAALTIGERSLTLPGASAAPALAGVDAGERGVIVGIRPEDLRLASESDPNTLVGTVDVVEHLGSEQLLYLQTAGALVSETAETAGVTARVAPDIALQRGERVALVVDPSKVHIFDPDTTRRL
jgi:multiple sugar transport system ATP-binding protein